MAASLQASSPVDAVSEVDNQFKGPVVTSRLEHGQMQEYLESLRSLVQVCVNPDPPTSSLGFLAPVSDDEADSYWHSISQKLAEQPPTLHLFVVATDSTPTVVLATAQLHTIPKVTHQHRAKIAKVLVHPSARRKGIAKALMRHVEVFARDELKREILMLDTATETPAREFYKSIGWAEWGTCPEYGQFADGRRADVTFFVKKLRGLDGRHHNFNKKGVRPQA
ncbi:Uu.00g121660.m01.CDS01 [Anthostomella pinea]|uniref:Uu.00g121660.m01.CDS01 n=1 Tax=Anthostomella pinea TaxID=933095 RepID=A0AAI8YHG7_9PEZI|nr:Uu.00g121660.m01.CDS01 [Anthostomella pinea]